MVVDKLGSSVVVAFGSSVVVAFGSSVVVAFGSSVVVVEAFGSCEQLPSVHTCPAFKIGV